MRKSQKIAGWFVLVSLLLVACSLPSWVVSRLEGVIHSEFFQQVIKSNPTPEATKEPVTVTADQVPEAPAPTTQGLDINAIEKSVWVESENPRYEISGGWPNLEGPEAIVLDFNQVSDRIAHNVQDSFIDAVNDFGGQPEGSEEGPFSYLNLMYDLTYSDQRLFSYYLKYDQYIAISAHPFSFSQSLNYDAQQAKFITLSELFFPGVNIEEEMIDLIEPALIERGFGYQVGTAADVLAGRENWNILAEGLRINFDIYEVAPYAAGPQYVLIPWDELESILDPTGPVGVFLP